MIFQDKIILENVSKNNAAVYFFVATKIIIELANINKNNIPQDKF
jgi:hypothetical protein